MNEGQAIVEAFAELATRGERAALVTVIETQGSVYRRPGARMLVTRDGRTVGAISGGCLENDVRARAQATITTGESRIVTYDTTSDSDLVWGLGLGCNGVVRVLIERLSPDGGPSPVSLLAECLYRRQPGVLAVVVRVEGQVGIRVGARLLVFPDGAVAGELANAEFTARALDDARAVLRDQRPFLRRYRLPEGTVQVFLEPVQPPLNLTVFGAGYDAVPLIHLAKELGWQATVIDERAAYATRERFPQADQVQLARPSDLPQEVLSTTDAAVIMTHHYLHDRAWLRLLLPSPVRYVGLLGPKRRCQRLLQDLTEQGVRFTQEQLRRLHAPVGLDIGAETLEEVALAITAEIKAVLAGRSGGLLKDRKAPIHDDEAAPGMIDSHALRQHLAG